jgi:uncharacterized protein (DUF1015 family)
MAEIKPFMGLIYNPEKVGELSGVMAPPYDVISPKLQDELYSRHPNNVVRLILAKTTPEDSTGSDRYSRAAADFKKWTDTGVLKRDTLPAIYYYTQKYTPKGGKTLTRKGFIALARIEEFGKGKIHAHEQTLSGPKADRLKLMEACGANFSCIFSLYSEPKLTINNLLDSATEGVPPLIDVPDDDGVENRLWRVDEPGLVEKVSEVMSAKALFIADGHHRYETSLNYRNRMKEKNPGHTGEEPYNYVMMFFSNMDDVGMTIWPTHRVIHSIKDFDADAFLAECKKYFNIEEFTYKAEDEPQVREAFLGRLAGTKLTAFGLHLRKRDVYYLLTLKSADTMEEVFGSSIPEVFKSLDVTVLHSLVLSKILGITREDQETQKNLVYVKSYPDAMAAMADEENQLVFLLNSTRIGQVKSVAEAGLVMPQKSTYFYPKLLTGLVINLHKNKSTEQAPAEA